VAGHWLLRATRHAHDLAGDGDDKSSTEGERYSRSVTRKSLDPPSSAGVSDKNCCVFAMQIGCRDL
jgi:hypothetical protein